MASTTRRQQYSNAVASLKPFVNADSSESFAAAVLSGQTLAIAVTTGSNPEIDQLKGIVSPVIDVINGGKFTFELLSQFDQILAGNNLKDEQKNKLATAIRFTLLNDEDSIRYSKLNKIGIISGDKSWKNDGNKIYSIV